MRMVQTLNRHEKLVWEQYLRDNSAMKRRRNMNWMWIIGLIVQFIIGRIQPGAASYATQRGRSEQKQVHDIAKAIVEMEPQLNFDCVMKVLPDFLDKLADVVKEKGFYDYAALVELVMLTFIDLVKCQLGTTSQAMDPAMMNKLLTCGIKWGFHFFTTKDAGAAISGFLSCVLGGGSNPPNPPGGGGNNPPVNPPPGGIDPEMPIFRSVTRCP